MNEEEDGMEERKRRKKEKKKHSKNETKMKAFGKRIENWKEKGE